MIRDIGSEFYNLPTYTGSDIDFLPSSFDAYFLSGRTALDAIVNDAIDSYSITSALLPSYCCDSMITPFFRHNISVRFYDITIKDGKLNASLPSPISNEIIYVMKYFGDTSLVVDYSGWDVSVEDLTHIAFDSFYTSKCTYSYTSYRKWFAVDGIATAYKGSSPLTLQGPTNSQLRYNNLRNFGFTEKKKYISGESINKSIFLNSFAEAEEILDEDYANYSANSDAILALKGALENKNDIISKRRSNAYTLLNGLNDIPEIITFCDTTPDCNCPLFVPIVVDCSVRDALKKHLIREDIYCPVHWPITAEHNGISENAKQIYKQELSLICDQRYSETDMERIIKTIKNFFT